MQHLASTRVLKPESRLELATELTLGQISELRKDIETSSRTRKDDLGVNSASHQQWKGDDRSSPKELITEPSKNFLQIPAHKTSADAVLGWDIFQNQYGTMALAGTLFVPPEETTPDYYEENFSVDGGILPADEERVPFLIDHFLENVHTKNPILDVEQLVKTARTITTRGFTWDASSCLVLVACALESVAKPFDQAMPTTPPVVSLNLQSPLWQTGEDLRQTESYFILACRRMGTLKPSLLGAQSYFFCWR